LKSLISSISLFSALMIGRAQVADRQVSIKLLGFGYGSGRKLTVSLR